MGSGSAGSNPAAQMLKEGQSGAPPAHRSEADPLLHPTFAKQIPPASSAREGSWIRS